MCQSYYFSYVHVVKINVIIPQGLNYIVNGKDSLPMGFIDKTMKCIMYIDSSYCNTCNIDRLLDWKPFVKQYTQYEDLAFYFIFEPKQEEITEIKELIKDLGIDFPIVLDEQRLFRKKNPDII